MVPVRAETGTDDDRHHLYPEHPAAHAPRVQPFKIKAFGNHLRPDKNVSPARREVTDHPFLCGLVLRRIGIETDNRALGESFAQFFLDPFGAGAAFGQRHFATGSATQGVRTMITTVMAGERAVEFVVTQGDMAMRARRHFAAGFTTLTDKNELVLQYAAVTDKPTILNPTLHAWFNLHGSGEGLTTSHILKIKADSYTPVDAELIPTGEIAPVEGTPFDFRAGKPVTPEFDHNFVLRGTIHSLCR